MHEPIGIRRETRIVREVGRSDPLAEMRNKRSFAAAIINSPSAVSNTSYGAMSGKTVPWRPGVSPAGAPP